MKLFTAVWFLSFQILIDAVEVLHENHLDRVKHSWNVVANTLDFYRHPGDYRAERHARVFCQRAGDSLMGPVKFSEVDLRDAPAKVINAERPTAFLIHGYMGHWRKPWIQSMGQRLLTLVGANVCLVDWSMLAAMELPLSVLKTKELATRIAQLVRQLADRGDLSQVSLIGYGLGAHLAGGVGRALEGRVGRIFGLDPMIEFNAELRSDEFRLDAGDGQLVQIAHTSIGSYGSYRPAGHQDFYFNEGGRSPQPGCSALIELQRGACSHFRAVEYMFHSLNQTNEFYDTRAAEKFGWFSGGRRGTFLVRTTGTPPYVVQ